MSRTTATIGLKDHGKRMTLDDFCQAEGQEGYLYELSRGVVTVSDVPGLRHLVQVTETRRQFTASDLAQPGKIFAIASGGECKIPIARFQSERHPDLAVYMSRPPDSEDLWAKWIPKILIEIVSPGSEQRDYGEKPDEYLQFGVSEYWIIDAEKQEVVIRRRSRGRWTEEIIRPGQIYRTRLLPGFMFDCARVFAAAEAV